MKYITSLSRVVALALTATFLLFEPQILSAQETTDDSGQLTGKVVAAGSESPLQGALLTATGAGVERFAKSDVEGNFSIELPAGEFTITVEHPQFSVGTFENVGITAGASQSTRFTLVRRQSANAGIAPPSIEEVVVTGTYVPKGADSERWSDNVVDIISAEDFAVTGDSSAVDALARVTGLTVVGDKYVYVRGLGERYSNTTFNRSALPSPDPTRRVIPLDLFPTGALEAVDIEKTYSARLPGDFSGGTVQLKTRAVPDEGMTTISVNVEANSETTGEPGLIFNSGGGFREDLGFDEGDRRFPTVLNEVTEFGSRSLNLATDEELIAASLAVDNNFDTELEDLPANYGIQFSKGDRFDSEEGSLGYLVAVRYDNDWIQRREERGVFGLTGQGTIRPLDVTEQFRTEQTIDLSGIFNLEWEINDYHTFRNVTFITRQTENRFLRDITFLAENDINVVDTTIEWVERQLFTQQVGGDHLFEGAGNLEFQWQATTAKATREEPDTRFYRYQQVENSDLYFFDDTGQSNERSWEDLEDDVWSVGFDLSLPVQFSENIYTTFQMGYAYQEKERDSSFRRFRFLSDFSQNDLRSELFQADPTDVFAPENLGPDLWELVENTLPTDNYTADEKIAGYYFSTDTDFGTKWRIALGARIEDSLQEVTTFELINPDESIVGKLDETQVLPALSATYAINDDMQIRFGISRTLNRPDLKELSEAPYIDPIERFTVIGNPDLEIAKIDNYDIRWEWYFNTQDNLQIAAFYKEFDSPIERVIRLGAGGIRTFANAESAENQGIEVQLRKTLGFINEDLWLKFNGAWIDSEVDIGSAGAQQTNQTRELQGQSPWVVNFQLGYDNPVRDIQATLLFNVAGERITDVGTQGLPDAFEQPAESLDFNYRHLFEIRGQQLRFKLRARNLLDPDFEVTQGTGIQRLYKKGRTVSLGVDWEF